MLENQKPRGLMPRDIKPYLTEARMYRAAGYSYNQISAWLTENKNFPITSGGLWYSLNVKYPEDAE